MNTKMVRPLASAASAALLAVAFRVNAAEPERVNPLAGLPSKPGPHVEKIKALGLLRHRRPRLCQV